MRRRRWITWTAIGAAAVALAGLALVVVPRLGEAEVRTIRPSSGDVMRTVVVSGRVRPPARIQIGSLVAGVVGQVAVREGDRVKSGDLLVQLDDATLKAALARAQASLTQAEAHLSQVGRVSRPVADAALQQAKVRRQQAADELDRVEQLVEAGSASRRQLDQARLELDLARSQERSARVQLEQSAGGGTSARAARAAVQQAEAGVDEARARLDQARILAPADGLVLQRQVEPGDAVQPGKVLVVLAKDGETELVAFPDERDLGLLAVGQRAVASADAYPDRKFDATVSFLAPAVDPDRGTVEMRLKVPERPGFLRPDMTVSIEVVVDEQKGALTLPDEAVRDVASKSPWVLVARSGKAVKVPVKIGLRGENGVQVAGGVTSDDRIIPLSAGDVKPGDRVEVKEAP